MDFNFDDFTDGFGNDGYHHHDFRHHHGEDHHHTPHSDHMMDVFWIFDSGTSPSNTSSSTGKLVREAKNKDGIATRLTKRFNELNTATKLTIIGGTVALGAIGAYYLFSRDTQEKSQPQGPDFAR